MQSKATFTGRPRRRTTHPWVKAGDRLARILITLGGISTIVAVLLVGMFLLAVALPLFRSAVFGWAHTTPLAHTPTAATALGTDESGSVGWLLDATAGHLHVFGVADGEPLVDRSAVRVDRVPW